MGKREESTRRKKKTHSSSTTITTTTAANIKTGDNTIIMPDIRDDQNEEKGENEVKFESEHHEKRDHHQDRRSSSKRNGHTEKKHHHRHHKTKKHRRRHPTGHTIKDRLRRYVYAAISSTFVFVIFREMGWIDKMHSILQSGQSSLLLRRNNNGDTSNILGGAGTENLAATAANLAGTSMSLKDKANAKAQEAAQTIPQASNTYISRADMMEHATKQDQTIQEGTRPIMYTFFEWIPPRNRGTQMSDLADKSLITEWKAAWKAAGWNPKILTLEDAKKHPQYTDYSPKLNKIPMLGVDGLGGNVIYNQLCFFRWLAMAQVGGGYMSDYDVFPVSRAPDSLKPPYNGNFTVYCKIKGSETAGIPCLMSGSSDEWTRMAYALLDNGIKNAETESMWSDMLALIDMRNDGAYQIHNGVLEGQDVLLKHGWTPDDCSITRHKKAIHFSHEALRLGYINPGETAEDRPDIIRRFLKHWHQACGSEEESMA